MVKTAHRQILFFKPGACVAEEPKPAPAIELAWRKHVPRYYFDITDGHRLIDPSGSNFRCDADAIARAKIVAIQVALDTPRTDPARYISVLDEGRKEISQVPVYSRPSAA